MRTLTSVLFFPTNYTGWLKKMLLISQVIWNQKYNIPLSDFNDCLMTWCIICRLHLAIKNNNEQILSNNLWLERKNIVSDIQIADIRIIECDHHIGRNRNDNIEDYIINEITAQERKNVRAFIYLYLKYTHTVVKETISNYLVTRLLLESCCKSKTYFARSGLTLYY